MARNPLTTVWLVWLQVLETVRTILDEALHDQMTSAVLSATKTDQSNETVYYDDFVGDGDLDIFNRTKVG